MSSSPLLRAHAQDEPNSELDIHYQISGVRAKLIRFFSTRTFHYLVLLLVALDVGCMFAGRRNRSSKSLVNHCKLIVVCRHCDKPGNM